MENILLTVKEFPGGRSADKKKMDAANVKTMLQAAINLELFTIPLYMYSMYSLTGMHQITSKNDLYRGRWWPGIAPSFAKDPQIYKDLNRMPIDKSIWDVNDPNYEQRKLDTKTNRTAFNLIFKVFIEEMFHVQLVSNLSKSLGVEKPSYTHPDLVTLPNRDGQSTEREKSYGWHCYEGSVIPYIVDLKHTKTDYVQVKLGPLNENQIKLFKVIEMPVKEAEKNIRKEYLEKYKVTVPFSQEFKQPDELPMFGSIGNLYKAIIAYIDIQYEGGQTLLDYMLKSAEKPYPQHDIFNNQRPGRPKAEYPGVNATLFGSDGKFTRDRVINMINAITGQGEGGHIATEVPTLVPQNDQSDVHALKANHKTYTDEGKSFDPARSSHAYARAEMESKRTDKDGKEHKVTVREMDHEEIFERVEQLMKESDFQTWDMWHKRKGNLWTANMLQSKDYKNNIHQSKLPKPEDVAQAMNNLKKESKTHGNLNASKAYDQLSQASAGSIKGVTTVLNKYWNSDGGDKVSFPSPSMGGSGDRLSICWAILGVGPNLKDGVLERRKKAQEGSPVLNHACQGLAIDPINGSTTTAGGSNDCADPSIYHTCKGSNLCKAEGGCGFVQTVGSHSNCGGKHIAETENEEPDNQPLKPKVSNLQFSAPGDNACGGQGGCAVPISASQLFPKIPGGGDVAYMPLFEFEIKKNTLRAIPSRDETEKQSKTKYRPGDGVYNIAWESVQQVLANRKNPPNMKKPEPNDLRLALPPST